jgi:hypothetical protein
VYFSRVARLLIVLDRNALPRSAHFRLGFRSCSLDQMLKCRVHY